MTACRCSPTAPHETVERMPRDGETHYVATIVPPLALPVSAAMAELLPAGRQVVDLVEPRAIEGVDVTAAVLRAKIAAALEALRIPKPDEPYNAWVNSGNRWTKAAHEARLALGAEQ